jgi:hypothetical protein
MLCMCTLVSQRMSRNRHRVNINLSLFINKKKTNILFRPLVRFMINYQFICKKCNVSGIEIFSKKQACNKIMI